MQVGSNRAAAAVTPSRTPAVESPWFAPLSPGRQHSWRVLALPQAGAGCAAFVECASAVGTDIAIWGLNLPGRQARFREPSITDLHQLVAATTSAIRPLADRPYVLFGYCSGALLAYLVATAARSAGVPAPKALVVASYPAPQHANPPRNLHTLPPDTFWPQVLSYGGFDAGLVAQSEHREIFEPALRADYQALSTFRYRPEPPLATPIVALAGSRDPFLDKRGLAAWAERTTAGFRCQLLDAEHWLLMSSYMEIARVLERECRA
jgi:medium-chain acyl-[acyl-carrier-protein] hydrolase